MDLVLLKNATGANTMNGLTCRWNSGINESNTNIAVVPIECPIYAIES